MRGHRDDDVCTVPAAAARAGLSPTSIYRRWKTREGLLTDVAMAALQRDLPFPDTGFLRADLTAWASSAAALLGSPRGRALLLALPMSLPSNPEAEAERRRYLQRRIEGLSAVLGRAVDRGEDPPDAGLVAEAVLRPIYFRALWGILPSDPEYPGELIERVLATATPASRCDYTTDAVDR